MKGENYLYFCDTTDEPNSSDEAVLIPASKVLGLSIGAANGTYDNDALYLSFERLSHTAARGAVLLACTAGKLPEAMDDVCAAMSATPGDGFTVIADVQNGVFCSPHITGCTVDTEASA